MRFPVTSEQEKSLLRNFLTFNKLSGVMFYDAGLPWDRDFSSTDIRQDIGLGLRFEVTILGFLEKLVNRFDIALPLNGKKDLHLWFDIKHVF